MHQPLPASHPAPPAAWLRLDASALLDEASPAALDLLAANAEVLQLQCRRLRATRQPERLEQALLLARDQGRCPLALVRGQRLPLTLLCERLAAAGPASGWRITLRDPETEQPDAPLVQALFGLTPSEAAVATALALGHSTAEIALALGVQANTVLAHVKKVLTKTGTRRQAQLVSLLLRSVAVVQTPAPGRTPDGPAARPATQPAACAATPGPPPVCGVAGSRLATPCPSG